MRDKISLLLVMALLFVELTRPSESDDPVTGIVKHKNYYHIGNYEAWKVGVVFDDDHSEWIAIDQELYELLEIGEQVIQTPDGELSVG